MKTFLKISESSIIEDAIKQSNNSEVINALSKFYKDKKEIITLDTRNNRYFINSFFPSFPSVAWDRFVSMNQQLINGRKALYQADIVVTGRCHCDCWNCYHKKNPLSDLHIDDIQKYITQAYNLGASSCGITGGEPMLRNDIRDILVMIPNGMQGQLFTTGIKIDSGFCDFLSTTNVTKVIISLDHYKKENVSKSRNNPHAYDDALNAVENLVKHNIYTTVTICITDAFSADDIIAYIEFIKNLHVQEIRFVMPIPQGEIEGIEVRPLYRIIRRTVRASIEKFRDNVDYPNIVLFDDIESRFYFGCSAGLLYLALNNDGSILPCVAVPLAFGNIKNDDLSEVLDSISPYFKCSGSTCYGKRIAQLIHNKNIDTTKLPLDENISYSLAGECVVEKQSTLYWTRYLGCYCQHSSKNGDSQQGA